MMTTVSARLRASLHHRLRSFPTRLLLLFAAIILVTGCSSGESDRMAAAPDVTAEGVANHAAADETGTTDGAPPLDRSSNPTDGQNDPTATANSNDLEEESSRKTSPHNSGFNGTRSVPAVDGPAIPRLDADPRTGDVTHHRQSPPTTQNDDATSRAEAATKLEIDGERVELFYATDRMPTSELVPSPGRIFLPAILTCCVCALMIVGLLTTRQFQAIWLTTCGGALCLTMVVLHSSILRWQQFHRIATNAGTRYSTARFEAHDSQYPLHVGRAVVSLPKTHLPGKIESPSLLRFEFSEDPSKHVVLHSLTVDEAVDDWFEEISRRVEYAEEREGFIFIHGYNVRFSAALKRTAQLATDLGITSPVISYSWPSRGQVAAYTADEATVSWSAPHLEQLLIDLRSRTNCRTFNVVAHSMGNRALLETIERISLRMGSGAKLSSQPKVIDSLILAAPDIDAHKFHSRYVDAIQSVAERTTVYFSDSDMALQLSSHIHASDRLGLSTGNFKGIEHIEAVHIGKQNLFSLGHSYYGSDVAVLQDMRRVIHHGEAAEQRDYLQQIVDAEGQEYWQLNRARQAALASPNQR